MGVFPCVFTNANACLKRLKGKHVHVAVLIKTRNCNISVPWL